MQRVDGTFTVLLPRRSGCPVGARFALDGRGLPRRQPGNVQEERFICLVPEDRSTGVR